MQPPVKPFPSYKWKWAVLTPTEGLNDPPVFLGVLRAFYEFEGCAPGDLGLLNALKIVKEETGTRVDLARTPERNLVRNSGQYWKGLGLLEPTSGAIELTPFGQLVAQGRITKADFAATVVRTLELPNPIIEPEDEVAEWQANGLRIFPLELILNILRQLGESGERAFLTPKELRQIVVPLAGVKASESEYVAAIRAHRRGKLDWPDPANARDAGANDKRFSREFLIFLAHYGFVARHWAQKADDEEYELVLEDAEVTAILTTPLPKGSIADVSRRIAGSGAAVAVDRRRVQMEVLLRPQQAAFRREVLDAAFTRCLLSGVKLKDTLEAAHIKPVKFNGPDDPGNGLCLRSDIHALFDAGHLRIRPDGHTELSTEANRAENYSWIGSRIQIPTYVNPEFLEWRYKYL